MVTRLRSRAVEAQAAVIRKYFSEISNAVKRIPNFNVRKNAIINRIKSKAGAVFVSRENKRRRRWRASMLKMWNQEQKWMQHELELAEEEMGQLQAELSLSRRARGVLPFVGDAFKWAFGTSTEEDTRKLHKQIKGIEVGVGKLHHLIELDNCYWRKYLMRSQKTI